MPPAKEKATAKGVHSFENVNESAFPNIQHTNAIIEYSLTALFKRFFI